MLVLSILCCGTVAQASDWVTTYDVMKHQYKLSDGDTNLFFDTEKGAKKAEKKLNKNEKKNKKAADKKKDKKEDFMNGAGCDDPLILC